MMNNMLNREERMNPTPVYEKRGPKWCIASPGGPRRVQTYPGLGSTTRMPFSPDTGSPRTARRGVWKPLASGRGAADLRSLRKVSARGISFGARHAVCKWERASQPREADLRLPWLAFARRRFTSRAGAAFDESSQVVVVLECASRARPAPTAVPECRGGPGHGDQRRGQQEGALWPRATRMHLAGRFFMTPGVARGPPERGMDLDLSQLTLAEKEAILRVIKRDEALRKMEERRIL
ncbi:hypothetical protein HPB47_021485 [Ixodes persulcatus]|uniref:Uncharacterized protein n=1 Tax=Ixodes persulcatus TaxID=34615 RepID=A0AC60QEQ4_IXOPE|nr:hypothetical protein HPB47_021485 [Ixodes persulcatus]